MNTAPPFGIASHLPGRVLLEPEGRWQSIGPVDDPDARLRVSVQICGVEHRLEAIAITIVEHHDAMPGELTETQEADDPSICLDDYAVAFAASGPWEAVEIEGRQYLFFLEPFS